MASPFFWLEVLAGFKALYDLAELDRDFDVSYQQHINEPDTIAESQRASQVFSTYTNEELKAISDRIQGCRKRFAAQGGGEDRKRCMCSILNEVKDGNGGDLPLIDDWRRMYDQLRCATR